MLTERHDNTQYTHLQQQDKGMDKYQKKLGCFIQIPNVGRGQLRYVGPVDGKQGMFVGVDLLANIGKNNGSFQGRQYFHTDYPQSGLFIQLQKVASLIDSAVLASSSRRATLGESSGTNKPDNNNSSSSSSSNRGNKGLGALAASVPSLHAAAAEKSTHDYQKVYNAIATKLRDDDEYDDYIGYGPVLVRLAWHTSGTFNKSDNTGGSYGGTYRFAKETSDPSNAGLQNGAKFLEPILEQFSWISHGDLYTLAGVTAVQEMQGPKIPWRSGRIDQPEETTPENGRLPDATRDANYVRNYFSRFGFNDREIVALIGAHSLGKTHYKNSGFEGPWDASPNVLTNDFFVNLLNEHWKLETNKAGNKQYNNDKGWMMLPTDMALVQDDKFLRFVKEYANYQDAFFKDFSSAFVKLLENGIEFPEGNKPHVFKTLDEQED